MKYVCSAIIIVLVFLWVAPATGAQNSSKIISVITDLILSESGDQNTANFIGYAFVAGRSMGDGDIELVDGNYSYNANSDGEISVERLDTGYYQVLFSGPQEGFLHKSNIQITAAKTSLGVCNPIFWQHRAIRVRCYGASGLPRDSDFYLLATKGKTKETSTSRANIVGYASVDNTRCAGQGDIDCDATDISNTYSRNSNAIDITRLAIGNYRVRFLDENISHSNIQITSQVGVVRCQLDDMPLYYEAESYTEFSVICQVTSSGEFRSQDFNVLVVDRNVSHGLAQVQAYLWLDYDGSEEDVGRPQKELSDENAFSFSGSPATVVYHTPLAGHYIVKYNGLSLTAPINIQASSTNPQVSCNARVDKNNDTLEFYIFVDCERLDGDTDDRSLFSLLVIK